MEKDINVLSSAPKEHPDDTSELEAGFQAVEEKLSVFSGKISKIIDSNHLPYLRGELRDRHQLALASLKREVGMIDSVISRLENEGVPQCYGIMKATCKEVGKILAT